MADELLDLVNDKDDIIGQVWKSDTHTNLKLIHREVAAIILNDKNEALFQKRSKTKKVNPGVWAEATAGHVKKGEKPLDAIHRELKEEMGFDTELTFYKKTLAKPQRETHFTYWYVGKFPKGASIILEKDEVIEARFLSPTKLKELIKSGEVYDPLKTGGQPMDVVKDYWKKIGVKI